MVATPFWECCQVILVCHRAPSHLVYKIRAVVTLEHISMNLAIPSVSQVTKVIVIHAVDDFVFMSPISIFSPLNWKGRDFEQSHSSTYCISAYIPQCNDSVLFHTSGLVHEHQLPKRNDYIHYFASNIDPSQISQLEIYDPQAVNTYHSQYDLSSIMHYDVFR